MKKISENPPARFPNRSPADAPHRWWVAKIKPRQEKALAFDFIQKNIEYYLPLITKITRRKDNNKPRKSILPLFAGYISFSADKNALPSIWHTNRVVSILEIKHQKKFIGELSAIYSALDLNIPLEPCESLYAEGTAVHVRSGPFRGIRGIIVKTQNSNKLIISLEGLGQAALAIDSSMVEPITT
jgi:transcription antitermination factor NusG